MKHVKRLVIVLTGLLLLTGVAAVFFTATETGLRWSINTALKFAPAEISIDHIEGRLISPLKLRGLHIKYRETEFEVDSLVIDWRADKLIARTLYIENMIAEGVHGTLPPSSGEPISLPDFISPLNLHIGNLTINTLILRERQTGKSYELSTLQLAGTLNSQGIQLDHLEISAPSFRIATSGNIDPHHDYLGELAVDWNANLPGYAPLAGRGIIKGDLSQLKIEHVLTSPAELLLHGTVKNPLRDPSWEATLSAEGINPNKINQSWPDVMLRGRLNAAGKRKEVDTTGSLLITTPQYQFNNTLDLHYADNQLTIRKLVTSIAGSDAQLVLSGQFTHLSADPQFDLTGVWRSLQWPIKGNAQIAGKSGRLKLSGDLKDYRLQLAGTLLLADFPEGEWQIEGHGNRHGFIADQLRAETGAGKLDGSGEIAWQPEIRWSSQIQLTDVNPGFRWPSWPGRLDISTHAAGEFINNRLFNRIQVERLHGELRNFPVDGELAITTAGDLIDLTRLRIDNGPNRFTAAGKVGASWDMAWEVNAAALADILPESGGVLKGSGRIMGPRAHPTLTASLIGKQIIYPQGRAAELSLVCTLDTSGEHPSLIDFSANEFYYGKIKADSISLRGEGTADEHRIESTLSSAAGKAEISISGRYLDKDWQGLLQRADVQSDRHGDWTLGNPSPINITPSQASIGDSCWQSGSAKLCTAAQRHSGDEWQATLRGDAIPYVYLGTLLPPGISPAGAFSFDASAGKKPGSPLLGSMTASTPPGSVSFSSMSPDNIVIMDHQGGRFTAQLDDAALHAGLEINLRDQEGLWAFASLPRQSIAGPLGNPAAEIKPLNAELHASSKELSLLSQLIPGLSHTRGSLTVDMQASGAMDKPLITGRASLVDGTITVPQLAITIQDIRATVESRGNDGLKVELQARSGQGTLNITGDAQYDTARRWSSRLTARGENIEIAHTPEFYALASPNLRLQVHGNRIDLEGDITIPEGDIRLRDLSTARPLSEDVIIVTSEESASPASPWHITSQVRVMLGEAVYFTGFGFKGRLAGDLRLNDVTGQPSTARGELSIINGIYKTYGQKLEIERGRLLFFGGPVDNPSIDVRAVRHIDEVTVGVMLRGLLRAPQATLFSVPGMPETDILSYLLVGRPMNQATTTEGRQLYGAAGSLGLAGGSFLASQIGSQFGLEDIHIESGGDFGEGALVIRHYLSPKLYIGYGVGLFEKFNTVLMRYRINRKWSVEAESGTSQSGADLLYTLERE